MNYTGIIIEESLEDKEILEEVKILSTKVEPVTEKHKTPWLKKWTMHSVEVSADKVAKFSKELSECMVPAHSWYADYKNDRLHFIVFRNKVFRIDRANKKQYEEAKKYGISLGIPEYQVDFHPTEIEWGRK